MSNTGNSVKNEAIREIAGGTVSGTYQLLGGVFLRDAFRLLFTNWTNGDIYLSTDGITDMMKMPAFSSRVLDDKSDDMYRKKGTQFSIRYDMTPGSPAGWASLEVEYV